MVAPSLDRCLDDESAAWFVGGEATDSDRARIEAHLDGCAGCRRRIAALALVSPPVQSFVALDDLRTEPADDDATIRARRPSPLPLPAPATAAEPPPRRESPGIPALGERIGRFVVLRTLGRGGMGVVVAAHDPELDRQVAIKLVHPTLWRTASHEARELLRSEARAMARLVHPNVVTVHDLGTIRDQLFVAMELVPGTSLDQWLAPDRGWREVLAVCVDAGRGIAAAHRAGLVHRDIKPHNVLVDGEGRARIADFGLAMLSRVDSGSHSPAGTPAYMSPEQHRHEAVGPASDQFSFCVMVYEALYGERPFGGRTPAEVAVEVLEGRMRPPPPKSRVPREVRKVLLRGLASDPAARWPTMDALLDALAPRPRSRRAAIAAVALGVVAAGAVTFAVLERGGDDPIATVRQQARADAAAIWNPTTRAGMASAFTATGHGGAAHIADEVAAGLDRFVERWIEARVVVAQRNRDGEDPMALAARRRTCLDRRLAEAAALIEALQHADRGVIDNARDAIHAMTSVAVCTDGDGLATRLPPPEEPARRRTHDRLVAELDQIKTVGPLRSPAASVSGIEARLAEVRALGHPPLTAEYLYQLGNAYYGVGKINDAEKAFDEAILEVGRAGDDELASRIFSSYLLVAAAAGEIERVRGLTTGATAAIERGGHGEQRMWMADALGTAALFAGDFEEALRKHDEALAIGRKVPDADSADLAFIQLHRSGDLLELGRVEEASKALAEGRTLAADALGSDSLSLFMFDTQDALIHEALGDVDGLMAIAERLLGIAPAGSSQQAFAKHLRANAFAYQGKREEAVAAYRDVSADFIRLGDEQREFDARLNCGIVLYELHRLDEAATELDRAIDIAERTFARSDPRIGNVHNYRGLVALDAEQIDRARTQCTMALDAFTAALGAEDPELVLAHVCLASIDRAQGRARAALDRARIAQRLADAAADPAHIYEAYDELSLDLDATGDRKGALAAVAKAIAGAEAAQLEVPDLKERQAKWQKSRR